MASVKLRKGSKQPTCSQEEHCILYLLDSDFFYYIHSQKSKNRHAAQSIRVKQYNTVQYKVMQCSAKLTVLIDSRTGFGDRSIK